MEHEELIEETEVTDAIEYAEMLRQWQGERLEQPTIVLIAEISPTLRTPSRQVALASARLNGEEGWVVLDGPRSTWYPKSEQPDETYDGTILKIHVGRQLLGFENQPNRKKYLASERPKRQPKQIIAAYEKLLAATAGGESKEQDDYDSFGVLGRHFDAYVDALVSVGRAKEINELIERFAPHWNHNLGYGKLGRAAYRAGLRDTAELYFVKLRGGYQDYNRAEEMSLLAEIWHQRGETQKARELLVDCLQKLVKEIQESEYDSDRKMHAKQFRHHRSTYLRLFPNGESELAELGLPAEPN
jgi:hypothetical protein